MLGDGSENAISTDQATFAHTMSGEEITWKLGMEDSVSVLCYEIPCLAFHN
jgi:hypothetical protein